MDWCSLSLPLPALSRSLARSPGLFLISSLLFSVSESGSGATELSAGLATADTATRKLEQGFLRRLPLPQANYPESPIPL